MARAEWKEMGQDMPDVSNYLRLAFDINQSAAKSWSDMGKTFHDLYQDYKDQQLYKQAMGAYDIKNVNSYNEFLAGLNDPNNEAAIGISREALRNIMNDRATINPQLNQENLRYNQRQIDIPQTALYEAYNSGDPERTRQALANLRDYVQENGIRFDAPDWKNAGDVDRLQSDLATAKAQQAASYASANKDNASAAYTRRQDVKNQVSSYIQAYVRENSTPVPTLKEDGSNAQEVRNAEDRFMNVVREGVIRATQQFGEDATSDAINDAFNNINDSQGRSPFTYSSYQNNRYIYGNLGSAGGVSVPWNEAELGNGNTQYIPRSESYRVSGGSSNYTRGPVSGGGDSSGTAASSGSNGGTGSSNADVSSGQVESREGENQRRNSTFQSEGEDGVKEGDQTLTGALNSVAESANRVTADFQGASRTAPTVSGTAPTSWAEPADRQLNNTARRQSSSPDESPALPAAGGSGGTAPQPQGGMSRGSSSTAITGSNTAEAQVSQAQDIQQKAAAAEQILMRQRLQREAAQANPVNALGGGFSVADSPAGLTAPTGDEPLPTAEQLTTEAQQAAQPQRNALGTLQGQPLINRRGAAPQDVTVPVTVNPDEQAAEDRIRMLNTLNAAGTPAAAAWTQAVANELQPSVIPKENSGNQYSRHQSVQTTMAADSAQDSIDEWLGGAGLEIADDGTITQYDSIVDKNGRVVTDQDGNPVAPYSVDDPELIESVNNNLQTYFDNLNGDLVQYVVGDTSQIPGGYLIALADPDSNRETYVGALNAMGFTDKGQNLTEANFNDMNSASVNYIVRSMLYAWRDNEEQSWDDVSKSQTGVSEERLVNSATTIANKYFKGQKNANVLAVACVRAAVRPGSGFSERNAEKIASNLHDIRLKGTDAGRRFQQVKEVGSVLRPFKEAYDHYKQGTEQAFNAYQRIRQGDQDSYNVQLLYEGRTTADRNLNNLIVQGFHVSDILNSYTSDKKRDTAQGE